MRYASESLTQVRRPGAARYEVPRYENDRSSLLPKCTLGNSRLTSPRERTLGTSLSRSRSDCHIRCRSVNTRCPVYRFFRSCIHLFQLRLLLWTLFHSLQCTIVNLFVAGSLVLFPFIEIIDQLWKGVQESFQVKWLLKFLSMNELKNFIFKIS